MEKAETSAAVLNRCKNCFRVIPKGLQFCNKNCMDELRFRVNNPSVSRVIVSNEGTYYTKINDLFTTYANSKGEEKERLGKIMDDNYELCKQYIETIRIIRETKPHLRKFSFEEWLELKGKIKPRTDVSGS